MKKYFSSSLLRLISRVFVVSLLLAAVVGISELAMAQMTKNVFIVVIDGARYTETFGDTSHQYIPKLWTKLRPIGTLFTSVWIDEKTETNPGHATILTGAWQLIKNDGTERPHQPTVFEYFRKEKNVSAFENYVILGKSKLNMLTYSDHVSYGSAYGASVQTSTSEYDDLFTWNNIRTVINNSRPRLAIVNMARTDNQGHAGSWTGYLSSIKQADSLVAELWDSLQADAGYRDSTTLIVTNDHGRHTSNFSSHGDLCEGCRHIMLLIVGPNTPQGKIDSAAHKQIDIAPTVGHLLGFQTPLATGAVLTSAVTSTSAPISQVATKFNLSQNYPNPFNPTTTIRYLLPYAANVKLSIYDMLGREIATLVNGELPEGWKEVRWSAAQVSSGIYFYRLEVFPKNNILAGSFVGIKKMIVIK